MLATCSPHYLQTFSSLSENDCSQSQSYHNCLGTGCFPPDDIELYDTNLDYMMLYDCTSQPSIGSSLSCRYLIDNGDNRQCKRSPQLPGGNGKNMFLEASKQKFTNQWVDTLACPSFIMFLIVTCWSVNQLLYCVKSTLFFTKLTDNSICQCVSQSYMTYVTYYAQQCSLMVNCHKHHQSSGKLNIMNINLTFSHKCCCSFYATVKIYKVVKNLITYSTTIISI